MPKKYQETDKILSLIVSQETFKGLKTIQALRGFSKLELVLNFLMSDMRKGGECLIELSKSNLLRSG